MSTWRLAKAIETLRAEVNTAHPHRLTSADGTIGDAAHAARKSDHNPVAPHAGVVTAWDITTADFTNALAENLRLLAKSGDGRVKYLIYRGRIASDRDRWAWRKYTGESPHFDHIHLSVSDDPAEYDRTDPWFTKPAVHAHTAVPPHPIQGEPDMVVIYAPGKATALLAAGKLTALKSNAEKDALAAAGIPVQGITAVEYGLIEKVAAR